MFFKAEVSLQSSEFHPAGQMEYGVLQFPFSRSVLMVQMPRPHGSLLMEVTAYNVIFYRITDSMEEALNTMACKRRKQIHH